MVHAGNVSESTGEDWHLLSQRDCGDSVPTNCHHVSSMLSDLNSLRVLKNPNFYVKFPRILFAKFKHPLLRQNKMYFLSLSNSGHRDWPLFSNRAACLQAKNKVRWLEPAPCS
jgi:hypothetical protein